MKQRLILIVAFLPFTLFGQQLVCCETKKDVETCLKGYWKEKDTGSNRQYRYEFNNGTGQFKVFTVNDDGALEPSEDNQPDIRILKTKKGFKIEHDFGGIKTYTTIKYLDSNTLIVARRDGTEKTYYRVTE